jgi:four helix bundle protein
MRDFREIKVWGKAHTLTLEIYRATSTFPREETYGLTTQLRRSSASIPTNIAEGFGRRGNAELARFLQIGMGSACEVEYQILLARDLAFLNSIIYEHLQELVVEIKRMLGALLTKVRSDQY